MAGTVVQVTPDISRYRLNLVKDWINENLGLTDVRLMGDYLRISEPLSENRDIELSVRANDGGDYILDKKLRQDDIFFITHLGVLVAKEAQEEEGNALLLSYPDSKIFKGTGEAKAIRTLYSGKLTLNDNHDRRFYDFLMLPFMKVPQLQVNADSNGNITQFPNISLDDTLLEWSPFEIVSGLASSKFGVRLGRGNYTGITDGGKNRVVIIAKGIKASGIASEYSKYAQRMKAK